MGQHRFGFRLAHVLQQAGTYRHQRRITARTGSKGVDVRGVVDRYLRHGDARLL